MTEVCCRCKDRNPGKCGDITFVYKGFKFTVFKSGLTCAECEKKEYAEKFGWYGKKLLRKRKEKIVVNWSFFLDGNSGGQDDMADILLALGIFSFNSQGNWDIVGSGPIGLNPRRGLTYLYFTRKEDAVKFARLEFANTLYGWEVCHMDEVLTKNDVLKKTGKK